MNSFEQQPRATSADGPTIQPTQPAETLLSAQSQPVLISGIEVLDMHNPASVEDAHQIAGLFKQLYEEYPDHMLEHPELISQACLEGKWIAFVKRDEQQKIVAHGALLQNEEGSYDLGRLVVAKSEQGSGVAKEITNARLEYARMDNGVDVAAIKTEMVTSHPATQKICEQNGFVPTGLHLHKFTHFFDGGEARESVLIKTILLDDSLKADRTVHLPQDYKDLAELVYSHLGCSRTICFEPVDAVLSSTIEFLHVDNTDLEGFGLSVISVPGSTHPSEVVSVTREQTNAGAQFIEVKLDISSPEVRSQALALKLEGFIFAGIEVTSHKDQLVLQKVEEIGEHSFQNMVIHTEQGRQLVDLVKQQALPEQQ